MVDCASYFMYDPNKLTESGDKRSINDRQREYYPITSIMLHFYLRLLSEKM